MKDFMNVLHKHLQINGGDISQMLHGEAFAEDAKKIHLNNYAYNDISDLVEGFTISIHNWTESNIELSSFKIADDGSYSGVLHFKLTDNFGLDNEDLNDAPYPGFSSWFYLQRYYKNKGKYKPFKTIVEIDYPISGKIEGMNK